MKLYTVKVSVDLNRGGSNIFYTFKEVEAFNLFSAMRKAERLFYNMPVNKKRKKKTIAISFKVMLPKRINLNR